MADIQETYDNISESRNIRPSFDEKMLPELIEGQIGKLNELDANVKTALEAAEKAENCAMKAQELSAGRGLFTDKKKAAIEGLQSAGIGLAEAVQTSAKAQKTAFEFQTRLAEITKYLFSLGVRNIAANRLVVRELEARLAGASENEISELARQEIMAVVLQLKEQEDLLKKQDELQKKQSKMADELKSHNNKIVFALTQVDDLELRLKGQEEQMQVSAGRIDNLGQEAKQQTQEVSTLRQQISQILVQRDEALQAHDLKFGSVLEKTDGLDLRLKDQEEQLQVSVNRIDNLGREAKQQTQEVAALQQQLCEQQSLLNALSNAVTLAEANAQLAAVNVRSTLNQRIAILVTMALVLSAAAYFLR